MLYLRLATGQIYGDFEEASTPMLVRNTIKYSLLIIHIFLLTKTDIFCIKRNAAASLVSRLTQKGSTVHS